MELTRGAVEDYVAVLRALLPPGRLFAASPRLDEVLAALAAVLARAHRLVATGIDEAFPDTAGLTFDDFEAAAGLPDASLPETPSMIERRRALVDRWTSPGGQTAAYLRDRARWYGYAADIAPITPWRVGLSTVDEPLFGEGSAHAFIVASPATTILSEWTVGASSVADPLRSWGNNLLEAIIDRAKPAHTAVLYTYG